MPAQREQMSDEDRQHVREHDAGDLDIPQQMHRRVVG
jgi:hypothetical protein